MVAPVGRDEARELLGSVGGAGELLRPVGGSGELLKSVGDAGELLEAGLELEKVEFLSSSRHRSSLVSFVDKRRNKFALRNFSAFGTCLD